MLRSWEHRVWAILLLVALILVDSWLADLTNPRSLRLTTSPNLPQAIFEGNQLDVILPDTVLLILLEQCDDELQAILTYEYLRSRSELSQVELLLTFHPKNSGPKYAIWAVSEGGLLRSGQLAARLLANGYTDEVAWHLVPPVELDRYRRQTSFFKRVYQPPQTTRLEQVQLSDLLEPLAEFIYLKSHTDRRVRLGIQPVPVPIGRDQARKLAQDILTVAGFYDLPLEYFLGIGAMENNFMSMPGDLEHAVWKRRPERGDIVLMRRGHRVLVLNYASGSWQITRETLKFIHRLYLKDREQRDYSNLPPHLHPPEELLVSTINSPALTTYAGLYFRYLLDRFNNNAYMAAAAYNGGPGNPNFQYADGVYLVDKAARAFLERSATLKDIRVSSTRFLSPLDASRAVRLETSGIVLETVLRTPTELIASKLQQILEKVPESLVRAYLELKGPTSTPATLYWLYHWFSPSTYQDHMEFPWPMHASHQNLFNVSSSTRPGDQHHGTGSLPRQRLAGEQFIQIGK